MIPLRGGAGNPLDSPPFGREVGVGVNRNSIHNFSVIVNPQLCVSVTVERGAAQAFVPSRHLSSTSRRVLRRR